MAVLKPRTRTPDLEIDTLEGGTWRLSDQKPENFTMIVAYRGLHCPICRPYLSQLDRNIDEFRKRGVEVIAISSDSRERAQTAKDEWKLENTPIGYGLSMANAREWGLFVSTSRGKTSTGVAEPDQFNEPGLFLVKPDQTLYASSVATMPFARPHFDEILNAINFVVDKDYPARGEA
jgi:peroxiredoxin